MQSLSAPAAQRLADLVVRAISCPVDPRCVELLSRHLGSSPTAWRSRCHAVGISSKAALDFARLLRLVALSQGQAWDPAYELDIVDRRTLRKLLAKGGVAQESSTPSIASFLLKQRLVMRTELIDYLDTALQCPLSSLLPNARRESAMLEQAQSQ